ncbi:MAG TPA: aminotransferase class I/II-fold pyridoxal phosphate-dependent enzyme [Candidatus Methylomirabilis sp.]|nr:aminotransferase class I/II-fold pyridoxal phosphate-dependent enzyme [Candidatus Methylomirabilis sp.]
MKTQSQKLGEFFNIGRDRGWDMQKQIWTVHQLINPEGKVFTLGEILDGIPLDLRLEKSGNRYGYPPLRETIIKTQAYNVPKENVLITSGTQHANFLAFAVALEAGDEAIIESPSWEQPKVLCETFHVEAKILRRRPELEWKFDLHELESLMTPRVKLIYLCHPSNPTGAVLRESELKDICRIAGRHGAYVVSDEIYRGLEWGGGLSPSAVNLYERGVSTASVSKTLGMSGLRLGWLATQDRQFLENCMDLKYYISLHQQSRLDEVVAMAALQPEKYWGLVGQTMAAAKVNYDITSDWMQKNGTFTWVPPRGGFLSFPSYGLDIPSWDLCVRLLEKPYKTYLLPGSCYGQEGHVRLGFGPGTPAESMQAGLEQISNFVADYRGGRVKV